ncbi:polyribonucleotide nucleotidyltransferase [candidate division TM6 bacterium RIFCSPHIGHO2_12_FULL_38_8]|nr:MAG: polyribonucleotide nucleotidyltransferase [candidate division TM6 bacterium RIFCSPHIGHO2_12_FULL_38_8]
MVKTFKLQSLGYEVTIGKFANQADGSVWLRHKDTVILSTAVMADTKSFPGFLPLSVDYREYFSASGRIPGGYLKREGRSSDHEILTSRLIDRTIRPLFPDYFFNEVQVLSMVYSLDKDALPAPLALLSSSLALSLSKIPFAGPVGAVQVGRLDGAWIMNPTKDQQEASDIALVVAGTKEGLCMVEGSSAHLSEDEFIDALFTAHEAIKVQVAWQEEICKEVGAEKASVVDASFNWAAWHTTLANFFTSVRIGEIFKYGAEKQARKDAIKKLKTEFYTEQVGDKIVEKTEAAQKLDNLFESVLNDAVSVEILKRKTRVDGRTFTDVRPIETQVRIMPLVHGSSFFQRGQTQAVVSVTLGSGKDAQRVDDLLELEPLDVSFMLHYNFPPFCVGEVKPLRGPGRREIGHGHLAASAIKRVLPDKKDFPYTIRIISDILESNGSSSMATVCGSTMALMDAGVPISNMVAGIAMGLLSDSSGQFQAITDITGFEDALGLMDFKVAGTSSGITAIQMDIKYKGGLPRQVFEKALAQAKQARLFILDEMGKVMDKPNAELSPLVPKMISIQIDPNKAGAVIGSGGKIIKEIIEKTGTTIDIDGSEVNIFGAPGSNIEQAVAWVKILADQLEPGVVLTGTIARLSDFGLFIDIAPGKSGLLHVSKISREKQQDPDKYFPLGAQVQVRVMEVDRESGKIRLDFADNKAR